MKKMLTIEEKQEIILNKVQEAPINTAIFGVEKEVALPLVKAGILHRDTWKYTGGCTLNSAKHNPLKKIESFLNKQQHEIKL